MKTVKMRNKLLKFILLLLLIVAEGVAYVMLYSKLDKCVIDLFQIIWGALLPIEFLALLDLFDNTTWKEDLRTLIKKHRISKDDYIRISFAYLFRIVIDGKYLLVKNARGTNNYQPVGGAYKAFDAEKTFLTSKLDVVDDDKIRIDESSKNDYRMRVPAKKLKKFVRRFDRTKNRESINDLSREFYEELKKTSIISGDNLTYRYCGRHFTGIEYSKYFKCYELLLADIVEFIPTKEQESELRELLKDAKNDYVLFADEEMIETCGTNAYEGDLSIKIADHTCKILQSSERNLLRRNKSKKYAVSLTHE